MIVRWFFIIGSLVFLFWYVPFALQDDMVSPLEIVAIAINVLCFVLNLAGVVLSNPKAGDE